MLSDPARPGAPAGGAVIDHRSGLCRASDPLVSVAVPSFNQARFLGAALDSIFSQGLAVEVFVADGGSTDGSRELLVERSGMLQWWRSAADGGQSAAINECLAMARAPYVCWLNSDDVLLPGALARLVEALSSDPASPFAYGQAWNIDAAGKRRSRVRTARFDVHTMAVFCCVSQPATLIRREAWQAVGGLDTSLHMAMDYDLWWRLFRRFGAPVYVRDDIACNRNHADTKTRTGRRRHYIEAIDVVRRHYGRVPLKWWLAWPYAVWFRSALARYHASEKRQR